MPDSGVSIQPVNRNTLQDQAYEVLKTAIITGQLASNTIYSVRYLAEELGISTTPVREALVRLADKNMVEFVPNRGCRIIKLSDKKLDELFTLRSLLESWAMATAAENLSPEVAKKAQAILKQMVEAAQESDLTSFLSADMDFHLLIMAEAGNDTLLDIVTGLRERTHLHGLEKIRREGRLVEVANEHHDILDAVAKGERERAHALTLDHLGHTRTDWAGE